MATVNSKCLLEETEHHEKLENHPFKYIVEGSGDPLVLIPGTGGNERIFCRTIPYLKNKFTVYSFSHIHVRGINNVISAWNIVFNRLIGEPFYLLGTSVGGRLVQYYAEKYPKDVRSLIIGNSYVDISELRRKNRLVLLGGKIFPYSVTKRLVLKNIQKSFEDHPDRDVFVSYFRKHLQEDSKHNLMVRAEWNFEELPPPNIDKTIPKLLLLSRDDPVIPPRTRAHLKNYHSDARFYEFLSGGHFPYLTRPKEYGSAILEFLQSVTKA